MNDLIFTRRNFYSLKRRYGSAVDLYHVISSTIDQGTGKKIINKVRYHVEYGVVIPGYTSRQQNVPSDVPFRFGGLFDTSNIAVAVDIIDLPINYVMVTGDYLVWRHKKYDVGKVRIIPDQSILLLEATETEGAQPGEIFELSVESNLRFGQLAKRVP